MEEDEKVETGWREWKKMKRLKQDGDGERVEEDEKVETGWREWKKMKR